MVSISRSVFRRYFSNIWTILDIVTIGLAMTAFVHNNNISGYRNGLNSFVCGLLWLKVIGLLKVINKDMSTFILSLLEILWDIKNFIVVLIVFVLMFGDMLHVAGKRRLGTSDFPVADLFFKLQF